MCIRDRAWRGRHAARLTGLGEVSCKAFVSKFCYFGIFTRNSTKVEPGNFQSNGVNSSIDVYWYTSSVTRTIRIDEIDQTIVLALDNTEKLCDVPAE